jgi:Xaa-Pro aminopeptidase
LTNHAGCQLSQAEYVVFPRDPDEAITVSTIDMFADLPARRARAIVDDVRPSGFRSIKGAIDRLRELDHDDARIGLVEVDPRLGLPRADHDALETSLPDATVTSVADEWWSVRSVKSDEEIDMIEQSARIGDRVMERLVEDLERGMPESRVFGLVADEMTRHGGELPTMILLESTAMADSDDAFQRERPRNRTLSDGDIIVNEHAARYPDGSESQFGTTISFGDPTADYREMLELMFEVHAAVVDLLRPGVTSHQIAAAATPIEESGYVRESPLVHGELGGGVGSGPHIGLPEGMKEHEPDFELAENMVLVPEVHVSDEAGTKGVFVCDTYAVTDGAPRRLNEFPLEHVVL